MLSNKTTSLLIGVMVASAFAAHTPTVWKTLSNLRDRQVASNERFYDWRNAYEALLPVSERWRKTYPVAVSDLVELYQKVGLERHGLKGNIDGVVQTGVSAVDVQGFDVGLSSLCIGTDVGGGSVRLTSPSASTLREGIEGLAQRKDIELGALTFAFDRKTGNPHVDVTGLCLRVRGGEA